MNWRLTKVPIGADRDPTRTSAYRMNSIPSATSALRATGGFSLRHSMMQKFALVASAPTKCQPSLRKVSAIVPHSLVRGMASRHLLGSQMPGINPMAVVIGDCVHFVVEYGGKTQKCRVSDIALLNKERVRKKDTSHEELIAIFEEH